MGVQERNLYAVRRLRSNPAAKVKRATDPLQGTAPWCSQITSLVLFSQLERCPNNWQYQMTVSWSGAVMLSPSPSASVRSPARWWAWFSQVYKFLALGTYLDPPDQQALLSAGSFEGRVHGSKLTSRVSRVKGERSEYTDRTHLQESPGRRRRHARSPHTHSAWCHSPLSALILTLIIFFLFASRKHNFLGTEALTKICSPRVEEWVCLLHLWLRLL